MAKRIQRPSKPPLFPGLPLLDNITVAQAQFFDNRKLANGTKGQSDYTLKLMIYTRMNKIVLNNDSDWWRIVQLIDPSVMLSWARRKHAVEGMTAEQFEAYELVTSTAEQMAVSGDFELVKVGHISSPPGKQYHIGQFVLVTKKVDEPINAFVIREGVTFDLTAFKPTRSRGAYRKPGLAKYAMIHDPSGLIGQCRNEEQSLRERVAARLEGDGL